MTDDLFKEIKIGIHATGICEEGDPFHCGGVMRMLLRRWNERKEGKMVS